MIKYKAILEIEFEEENDEDVKTIFNELELMSNSTESAKVTLLEEITPIGENRLIFSRP